QAPVVCGVGAVVRDGQCIPETLVQCGAGTRLEDDTCVPDVDACGEGTLLENGQCISSGELSCGPGTERVDDTCVPLDPLKRVTVPEGREPNVVEGRFKRFELPAVGAEPAVLGGV